MISRTIARLALTGLALSLASCSGGSDETEAPANAVQEAPIVENMGFENMVEPLAPTETPTPSPTPSASPTPVAEREQMQEDAEATGMTARVERSEASADETQPAEVERKQ